MRKNPEDLIHKVIGLIIKVHKNLGPGLLESTYEKCLCYEFRKNNIRFSQQIKLPIKYNDELLVDEGYRIDILVEDVIVLELKVVEKLVSVHEAQILTYMKLGNFKYGLLINFNEVLVKNGMKRFISS